MRPAGPMVGAAAPNSTLFWLSCRPRNDSSGRDVMRSKVLALIALPTGLAILAAVTAAASDGRTSRSGPVRNEGSGSSMLSRKSPR
jgi:hypothetical protein